MDYLSLWHQIAPWACGAVLGATLGVLSWIDLRTGYLPFRFQIPLGIVGLAVAFLGSPIGVSWRMALLGAAVNAGMFAAVRFIVSRWKQREAMGQGDIWLVGVGGLWLGPMALPFIMVIGAGGTLIGAGIVGALTRKPVWQGEMPLGPGLAVGIFGCFVGSLLHLPWLQFDGL